MAPLRTIRGISWDHPRGFDCLAANVPAFQAANPDIEVVWERRSLKQFGEQPIDALAERYDLIVADHPFVGHGAASGCLIDVTPIIGKDAVDAMLQDSVGKSSVSYHWNGGVYGLPTDAASQVASYRPDIMAALKHEAPQSFGETIALAKAARAAGKSIATPACPTDAMSLILSFTANLGQPLGAEPGQFWERRALEEAFAYVEELVAASHPSSPDWNPIQGYNAMSSTDEIAYISYAFGYSNYSRKGVARPILFTNVAGPGSDPRAGALLGGAGCAVTSSARDFEAIGRYLRFVHDPAHQRGAYFDAGGQPGSRSAWLDERVNAEANNFFRNTLETLDKSFLRPRFDGFVPFFEEGGEIINARLRGAFSREAAIDKLSAHYEHILALEPAQA
ncbi:ABC transporter substrate-binding protein [Bosea sp. BK604]|uniref:extracellular solute-binding protein n=1 Tax=Bosea sp. BK604 TaxID=2512180 RepID=UPI00104B0B90|nr:ABC transporter substrate-binding protein [Bosea sp. BK604]TCR63133.1 carbohydrate ABC transporter substrate-binding protein (CUT1 family) [Bosea sp. BK604]